jgi:fructosamine-3-kinase
MSFKEDYNDFFSGLLLYGLGIDSSILSYYAVAGGDINLCAVIVLENQEKLFVKWNENPETPLDFLKVEAQNLELLRLHGLPVPVVIGEGIWSTYPFLVLSYFNVSNWQDPICDEHKGRYLATLHYNTQQKQFGLDYSNYIGYLIQNNTFKTDAHDFLIQNRLMPTAGLAYYNEIISLDSFKQIEAFCDKLCGFLPKPKNASLLHGDFHYNNVLHDYAAKVVFIDPSCYYGIREMDLAVAELFQGFSPYFLDAYQETFPLEPDWHSHSKIYMLYPLLVHVNLFPHQKSYLGMIESILKKYMK